MERRPWWHRWFFVEGPYVEKPDGERVYLYGEYRVDWLLVATVAIVLCGVLRAVVYWAEGVDDPCATEPCGSTNYSG